MSDNVSSVVKAFQVSLPQFILQKSDNKVDGYNEEQLFTESVSVHDFVEGGTDINSLLSYLPERVSCFAHSKQLCSKNCPSGFRAFKVLHWKAAGKSSQHCKFY